MKKARKLLIKILQGEFTELVGRAREELIRRRERKRYSMGSPWFRSSNYPLIFEQDFLARNGGNQGEVDFAGALRAKIPERFFPGFDRVDQFKRFLDGCPPATRDAFSLCAARALKGEFPVFHRALVSYGTPPAWSFDPDSRKRAPDQFYADIPYLDAEKVGDAKVIWELSRLQFVYDLGQEYLVSNDEVFAERFFELLRDWNAKNPDYCGINFCSALEFAFRAHSLAWAVFFFRSSKQLNRESAADIYRGLHISGLFLRDHLSTYFAPNTHLLGEAYGLYLIGTMFPEFLEAEEWKQCGRRILLEQLDRQFTSEGMHAERTTCYHAYALEFYLSFLILADRNEDKLPSAVRSRLMAMTNVLASLRRPDGRWPDIGDNDGGRLYFLGRVLPLDYSPILAAARQYLDGTGAAEGMYPEVFWLCPEAVGETRTMSPAADPGSALMADGGLIVSRAGDHYSAFQFGPFGYLDSPHSHADHLHLEICVGDDALLVDPGTFSYTGNRAGRNQFRAAVAHNGPRIFGQECYDPEDIFAWRQQPHCRLESYYRGEHSEFYKASYAMSIDADNQAHMSRAVLFLRDGYWLVRDWIRSSKPVQAAWDFRSKESIQWKDKTGILSGKDSILTITPIGLYSCDVEMINSWIPRDYGQGSWGGALRVIANLNQSINMGWLIQPSPKIAPRSEAKDPSVLYERTETNAPENEEGSFPIFKFAESPNSRIKSDAEIGHVALGPLDSFHAVLVRASFLTIDGTVILQCDRVLEFVDLIFDGAVWTIFADAVEGITVPDPSICRLKVVKAEF